MSSKGPDDGQYQARISRAREKIGRSRSLSSETKSAVPAIRPRGASLPRSNSFARKPDSETDADLLKILKDWTHEELSLRGISDRIDHDLCEEFKTAAVIPIRLMEALLRQTAAGVCLQPKNTHEVRCNVDIFIKLVDKALADGARVSSTELMGNETTANTKLVLGLMWRVYDRFSIGEETLRSWVSDNVSRYRGSALVDGDNPACFWKRGFCDGSLLCDLLCSLKPELNPELCHHGGDPVSRLKLVFECIRSNFDIEAELSAKRVAAGKVGQKSMMVYVASLKKALEDLTRELRKQLVQQRDQWLTASIPTAPEAIIQAREEVSRELGQLERFVSRAYATGDATSSAALTSSELLHDIWQETEQAGTELVEKLSTLLDRARSQEANMLTPLTPVASVLIVDGLVGKVAQSTSAAAVHRDMMPPGAFSATPSPGSNEAATTHTASIIGTEQSEVVALAARGETPVANSFAKSGSEGSQGVGSGGLSAPSGGLGEDAQGTCDLPSRCLERTPKRQGLEELPPPSSKPLPPLATPALSGPVLCTPLPLTSNSVHLAEVAAVAQTFRRSLGDAEQQLQACGVHADDWLAERQILRRSLGDAEQQLQDAQEQLQACEVQVTERLQTELQAVEDRADDEHGALALLATWLAENELKDAENNRLYLEADLKAARLRLADAEADRAAAAETDAENRAEQKYQAALKEVQSCEQAHQAAESVAKMQQVDQEVRELQRKRVGLEAAIAPLETELKALEKQELAMQETLDHLKLELASQVCEWQWEMDGGVFKAYDAETQRRLEAAYVTEGPNMCQQVRGTTDEGVEETWNVLVSYGKWRQIHAKDKHRRRPVQRVPHVPDKSPEIAEAIKMMYERRMDAEERPQATCCFAPWRLSRKEEQQQRRSSEQMESLQAVIDAAVSQVQSRDSLAREREQLIRVHNRRLELQANQAHEHNNLCRQIDSLKAQLTVTILERDNVVESLAAKGHYQTLQRPDHWTITASKSNPFVPVPADDNLSLWSALRAIVQTTRGNELSVNGRDHAPGQNYNQLELARAWRVQDLDLHRKVSASQAKVAVDSARAKHSYLPPDLLTLLETRGCAQFLPGKGLLKANEKWLLHGTRPEVIMDLVTEGFSERLASIAGGMFGCGSYFAEDSAKSDQYVSRDDKFDSSSRLHSCLYSAESDHPENVYYMLLCRVSLGAFLRTKSVLHEGKSLLDAGAAEYVFDERFRANPRFAKELSRIPNVDPVARHHSLVVEYGGDGYDVHRFREFVVFHGDYVYPEYLLAYKRVDDSPPDR